MESTCQWCPLPVFPGLPALLVCARFGESSYAIHVTDLANSWTEKLERRGILLRSLQENTSIDLVDADSEQWSVFLSKLKDALDPASANHHLTSLSLATDTRSGNDGDLALRITCELPKPLAALSWPIHLTKCQPSSLASELMLPLIQALQTQRHEAEDLMNQLKEKDAVINKLIDKLSTMHTPLELIFNSLSAKHAITRAAAEDRIKGLAPFDEEIWRSNQKTKQLQDVPTLLHSAFNGSKFNLVTDKDLNASNTLNDWWTKLGSGPHISSKSEPNPRQQEKETEVIKSIPSSEDRDNEEFQVQLTPAHLTARSTTRDKLKESDATESDESEISDSQPTRLRSSPPSKLGALGKKKKNTTIGGNKRTSQLGRTLHNDDSGDDTASGSSDADEPTPAKHTARQSSTLLGAVDGRPEQASSRPPVAVVATTTETTFPEANAGDTASGSNSGSDNDIPPPTPPPPPPQTRSSPTNNAEPVTPRRRGEKLGRIGGGSKKLGGAAGSSPSTRTPEKPAAAAVVVSSSSSDDDKSSKKMKKTEVTKKKIGKIGAIGKKQAEIKRTHSSDTTPTAEPNDVVDEEEGELETEEQKAERKRAELAKELSRQAAAVPARKKRKF